MSCQAHGLSSATSQRSVVLPRVRIGEHCRIHRAIIDSGSVIPDAMQIGVDPVADAGRFYRTEGGITLVTPTMLRAVGRGG